MGKKDGKKLSDGIFVGVDEAVVADVDVLVASELKLNEVGEGLALTGRSMWSVGMEGTSVGGLPTSTLVMTTAPVVVS